MERKNKSSRRTPLDSLMRRSSNGILGFLDKPKVSLGTSATSPGAKKVDGTPRLDSSHNNSTQLGSTRAAKQFPGQSLKRGLQDLLSKSVASGNMMKASKSPPTPAYKSGLKITESIFSSSVYKLGHSPKGSFASGAIIKPSSCNKRGSLTLAGSSSTVKQQKKDSNTKFSNFRPTHKSELHVYETFQDFLGKSTKKSKAPKEDKGRPCDNTEDGMSTTRPISVEENKPIKFKKITDKKRQSTAGMSPGQNFSKKSDFRSTDFGQVKSNIMIEIPKKYKRIENHKDSWMDFKSYMVSSTSSKNDVLRLNSPDKENHKKEVSLSIRGRVNVVKESPLIPFNSHAITSVFFPAKSVKDNKLQQKESKGESKDS